MIVRLEPDMTVLRREVSILRWAAGANLVLLVVLLVKVFAA
jgi:hypothetical protein